MKMLSKLLRQKHKSSSLLFTHIGMTALTSSDLNISWLQTLSTRKYALVIYSWLTQYFDFLKMSSFLVSLF